jgi:hypothetical protein
MNHHRELFDRLLTAENNLSFKLLKVGAVMRLMQFRLREGGKLTDEDETDIRTLVDVCLDVMPHHNNGEINDIDNLTIDYSKELKRQALQAEHLDSILNATQIVSRLDSTCEELTKAAEIVFDIAQSDDAYEPDWLTTKETLEARGLLVDVVTIRGFPPSLSVKTKEGARAQKKTQRAISKLVQATNQATGLSKGIAKS